MHGVSDIDICIYSDLMRTLPAEAVAEKIRNSNRDFLGKTPYVVDDNIGRRIEFYIRSTNVVLDITLFAPEIPNISKIETNACRDGIDMLIGAIYIHGVSLFGVVPQKEFACKNLIPFYSDSIRLKRLEQLYARLVTYSKRLRVLCQSKSRDILDHVYSFRNYFVKWLFIYKRQYPLSIYKHLEYQFRRILALNEEEINALMFIGDGDLFSITNTLLSISGYYFEQYQAEIAES